MANSTVYDIRLQYSLKDNVTKPLAKIDKGLATTAKSAQNLQKKSVRPLRLLDGQLAATGRQASGLGVQFRRMVAGASAYFGIRAGVKHLIGFNSNMEQAKIQMAGMIQLSTGASNGRATQEASKLVGVLQQKAKASVGTTKDMVDMASLITRPVLAAGMGMDQLANFTAQAVVASKAFGIESGMAARDIEAAMMGQLRSVDRFSRNLLEPLGYVGDAGREAFNALGAAARAAKLEEALGGPAIAAMAQAQAGSLAGVLSTFQDTIQMSLGAVGLPLFKEITAEIVTWNQWITKNGDVLANVGAKFGQGLVTGFRMVKSVLGFMVTHADLLLTVAKIWASVKVGQKIGGMIEQLGQASGGFARRQGGRALGMGMDKAGMATAKFGLGITAVTSKLAMLAPAIGVAAMAFSGIHGWFKDQLPGGVKDEKKRVDAVAAAKSMLNLKQEIGPLLDARLAQYGSNALSPFDSTADRKLGMGIAGDKFFNVYEAFQGKKLTTARAGAIPGAGAPDPATQVQMSINAKRLEDLGGQIESTTGDLALFALEHNLFSSDLKHFREKGLADLERDIGDNSFKKVNAALDVVARQIAAGTFDLEAFVARQNAPIQPPMSESNGKKPEFNVTIQRIEVQSDDPSRFVIGLTETVRDAIRNRSAAYDTLVEGS